ncbi:putative RNA-binding protein CG14230 [Anticarsia gemmatalis]|uniref:putative RNA-binding protein CG14230 n=1 Tax=Anticarsia gemmatalis TaxID=129554 RepID=UPI003F76BB67
MISATRLFVGNLPDNTQEKELQSAFSVFGEITNLDLKSKAGTDNESKKFAFVSLSASNADIESCIKRFSNEDFKGNRLYVTRARESFLERLQRERQQAQEKEAEKHNPHDKLPKKNPTINLSEKLNPRKRKIDNVSLNDVHQKAKKHLKEDRAEVQPHQPRFSAGDAYSSKPLASAEEPDQKKSEAERKRMESMKKKRQEFKEKQNIIKTGLTGVDKKQNKKLIFTDDDDAPSEVKQNGKSVTKKQHKNTLFDEDAEDSDNELNFEVKKQFEGKKGQKVLDLQTRYKSDKRFTLDERFIDEDEEEEGQDEEKSGDEEVELGSVDEKAKQLNILQDVLGVTLKTKVVDADSKKSKPKLGMLRFDPMQPDHAKFLAPQEPKPEPVKKGKKKAKEKQEENNDTPPQPEVPKVEVSKEQFYKVSDTLKEAIAQPNTFSLRSLFGNNENVDEGPQEQETDYIPLNTTKEKRKVKNPLDKTEKNPFKYDSSDSETEEPEPKTVKLDVPPPPIETKAVWKENLFFTKSDPRLKDGLLFFSKAPENEVQKERRELKSLVKKRIYNNDRKNQMFKKKIGGRKKSMKKPYKNKN